VIGSRPRQRLQPATQGAGPLFQRDYWAVIKGCRFRPSEVVAFVAQRFPEFPPPDMVAFRRSGDDPRPLAVGDELDIHIRMSGPCRVRVLHTDVCSFTLGTLEGHPEAGRITFGAYRNVRQDVIFHIRSRARSSSLLTYLGFRAGGDPMQTSTWTDFVDNVALTCGEGVRGYDHADTLRLRHDAVEDADATMAGPTFLAQAD
jgi:hypothetical protein